MSTIWRTPFRKDFFILLIAGILLASAFSAGLAWVADRYFGQAINGLMGDYGQYDLFLQVRSETLSESRTELDRLISEYLPGATVKIGPSLVGKTAIFLSLPDELRRRDTFEGLDAILARVPGWSGLSLLLEPRLTISSVHGGAQEMLLNRIADWGEVRFAFRRGGNIEIVLQDPDAQKAVSARVQEVIKEYRLVELRFPTGYTLEDALESGSAITAILQEQAGSGLVRDVTLADGGDDYQYLMNTLIEMKRFLGYYAAEVMIELTGDQEVRRGDQLALQGTGRPLITGEAPGDGDVIVQVDSADSRQAHGIIIRGDSRDVARSESYLLNGNGKVQRFAGMAQVRSRRDELINMLDESEQLLTQLHQISPEAAAVASNALEQVLGYSRLINDARQAQSEIKAVRAGLGEEDPVQGRARLEVAMRQIDSASAEMARLSTDIERLRTSVEGLGEVAARLNGFNNRLSSVAQFLSLGDGIENLLSATRALGALSEGIAAQKQTVAAFSEKMREPLAAVEYWREKVLRFQSEVTDYTQLLAPGGDGRKRLDDLITVTDRTITMIAEVDPTGISGTLEGLAGDDTGEVNLTELSAQIGDIRNSLPNLRDEEIGRSVAVIEQYVGDQAYAGEKVQLLTDQTLSVSTIKNTVRQELKDQVDVVTLPIGAIQPNLRGEVFRVLGEVRTTIAALSVFVLGILAFLLDYALIFSVLKRQARQRVLRGSKLRNFAAQLAGSPYLFGSSIGLIWFVLAFLASGADIPAVGVWGAAGLGFLTGCFFTAMCEKFNPVDDEEIVAGEAMGQPFETIMREIVIPAGRPGLMQWLNRRRLVMK
jgi:hypothetical protein